MERGEGGERGGGSSETGATTGERWMGAEGAAGAGEVLGERTTGTASNDDEERGRAEFERKPRRNDDEKKNGSVDLLRERLG